MFGHSVIGQLHLEHNRQDVTLGHSKLDSYVRTQEELYKDTVDRTITLQQSRQDVTLENRKMGHLR